MAKWIQAARERMQAKGTVGSLHEAAGVSEKKNIPASKLSALESKARGMKGPDGKLTGRGSTLLKKVLFAKNAGG